MAERLPLRILVAEDNLVYRQLALQLLQRMGYRADVVGNGLEVLDALQTYDVVLMDVNMPKMDGLTATSHIIEKLPPEGRPRIIAMTGYAMQGERDKCLRAGMNDYVSKPILARELVRALSQCQPLGGTYSAATTKQIAEGVSMSSQDSRANEQAGLVPQSQPEQKPSEPAPAQSSSIDPIDPKILQDFRDTMGDSADMFLAELIDVYLEDSPSLLQQMSEAIALGDMAEMQAAAHTLKSSSASLGAMALCELCQQLETLAKSPSTSTIDLSAMVSQLESEYEKVKLALQAELQGE